MGIFSIFVINTVHYQPNKKISGYNGLLI
ncbi:TPA: erythromycin resistance leader peptide [Streptococcus pyogenes]|nr:erythromycin resistance leader peptide [Streptococcus pyogenes]HER9071738.1 erythromycin resistance leader peptide [Streptococcus pyogenes]HES7000318.1 erythromycin resistance leader peptide [Streptococcus pyogenes]HES7000331.1 erythromycin resistance leader peptide [Streptococcus pyogenes]